MTTVGLLMPLKDRLRELRTAASLSQQDLAMKAGITVSAVVQLEAGKIKDPRMTTLRALAKALGVSLDDLAGEEATGDKPPPEKPKGKGKKGGE